MIIDGRHYYLCDDSLVIDLSDDSREAPGSSRSNQKPPRAVARVSWFNNPSIL